MPRFKDPKKEAVYRLYIDATPPTVRNSLSHAYRRGLSGQQAPVRTSLAYAAWAAGLDKRTWSSRIKADQTRHERGRSRSGGGR